MLSIENLKKKVVLLCLPHYKRGLALENFSLSLTATNFLTETSQFQRSASVKDISTDNIWSLELGVE